MVAIGRVALTIIVAVPVGYGLSKFRFPGQALLFILIMARMRIPFQSILTPLFLILKLHGYDAHAEIEPALVRLNRVTRDPCHLDLANYFVKECDQMPFV